MKIVVIGLNHKTAPLSIRERIGFPADRMHTYYRLLTTYPRVKESLILSTCNRVEVYGAGLDVQLVADNIENFIYRARALLPGCLAKYFYKKIDSEAVHHLFRVAGGLDSMILGENQILGQIRRAYSQAQQCGAVGSCLHTILQEALHIGKKVRSQTAIGRGVTSIPGAAVELIKKEKDLGYKRVLVIGAGKIGSMTVTRLEKVGVKKVVVANRTISRAKNLSKGGKVRAAHLPTLRRQLMLADIVITATASPRRIITQELIEEVLSEKKRKLLLIDLGVPRNIQETVKTYRDVRLYNIEDLAKIVEKTIRSRAAQAERAEEIISDQVCEKSFLG